MELGAIKSTGGKTVAFRSELSARDLVEETLKKLPKAPRREQFEHFQQLLADEPEYQRSVDWYYFNNLASYMLETRKNPNKTARTEASKAAVRFAQDALKDTIKQSIQLLALTMPNGKLMRECTGAEMASFGGAYQRIAAKVGRAKRVGDVLSEDQVRSLAKLPTAAASR